MSWFNIIKITPKPGQKKLFTDNVQEDLEGNVEEGKEVNPKYTQQSREIKDRKASKKLHEKKIKELFPPPKPGQKKLGDEIEEE
tara:strand:+ start:461 stop:712 length:252 start_codon:yes stop_codon:yes gene_type:complete